MKKFITTPIYYVNDIPHIGHAYTTIAADVLSRYWREKGEEVFFLTGTDEHGAKIAEAAEKANKSPKEFVDELALKFKEAWKNLNIENSEFFRTTNPEHEKLVQELVGKLFDKGLIEKRKYEGLYCVGCEKYIKESELVNGMCPDHPNPPIKQSEENYFFKLSNFSDQILEKIESGEIEIGPESRKNEVIGKIKQGLEDVSISRAAVSWGIKFPGDETQTIYVWVDALFNYYTATKIYKREDLWPADIHLIGKDILWFHAVIWPAILIALDLPLPKKIFANGYFTVGGRKMGKSLGNAIDPNEMVKKYGADALRYAVLREFPFGEDGDISEEKIAGRYKNDLADGLGNLLQRTLTMIKKYDVEIDKERKSKMTVSDNIGSRNFDEEYEDNIKKLQFDEILSDIWLMYVKQTNQLIDSEKPWKLAETNIDKLNSVLSYAYNDLSKIAEYIKPFMPETAEKMKKQLETLEPEPLFPRLEN